MPIRSARRFLPVSLATILAIAASSQGAPAAAPPNIVLLLADDMGWGDVSHNGNDAVATPAIDRLYAEGVTLDRFYVSPVCSPTRSSLLTGRHHLRLRVLSTTGGLEVMDGGETTLAEALKPAGYASGCFGKWHNGANHPCTAQGQGFDEFLGFNGGFLSNYFDPALEHDGTTAVQKGFITDVLTDGVIAFIEKHAKRPFFCYVPFNACHSPMQAPDDLFAKYRAKGFEPKTAAVFAMVENLDTNVGRILARLAELDLAENTIVVFASDNGPMNTGRFNGGMRGAKGSLFEGGQRVPCVIRWPGTLPTGAQVSHIAQHIDVLPTLLDLAGVALPSATPLDGTSLAPLLRGTTAEWPDRVLFEVSGRGGRDGDRIRKYPGTARSQTHRWVHDGKQEMLFDLRDDPGEQTDIATQEPALAAALSRAYDGWFAQAVASTQGLVRRFAITLAEGTDLLAPYAALEGGARFFGKGWDNDWAVFPRETAAVVWNLVVPQAGSYEVSVLHTATRPGGRVRATLGDAVAETVVTAAYDPPVIPRRDLFPRWEVPDKEFAALNIGTIAIPSGMHSLRLTAAPTIEIQSVRLQRIDAEIP